MIWTRSFNAYLALTCLLALAASRRGPQQVAAAASGKCPPSRLKQMDTCASKMGFLGDHSFLVPKNASAMDAFCGQVKDSISCLQSYTRDCMQGFTKQLLTSLLKRGRQQHQSICAGEDSRRNFMSRLACLVDDKIATFHGCMDASTARFEYIASRVSAEAKLQSLCCSYHIFNRDVATTVDAICREQSPSGGKTNEFIHKVVSGTAGDFFSLICDHHRSLDECRASAKTRAVVGQLEEVTLKVKRGDLKAKSMSIVPVLLEILDSTQDG